ncbi:hypothetical protein PSR1_04505 [Anaeromyxobacter sp. PSR-1]|nr:hypothetical protein PSR1_04505 [Anaeromyxobacter sp. PSR-1]
MGRPICAAANAASGKNVTPGRSSNSIRSTTGPARASPIRPSARMARLAVNGSTSVEVAMRTSVSMAAGSPTSPSASTAATCV